MHNSKLPVAAFVALVIGCSCLTPPAEKDVAAAPLEVRAQDAPVEFIQQECMPILNNAVDSLCAAKERFPELARIQPRYIEKPFDQFSYRFRVTAVPGEKAMKIDPGGCCITFFLEPFSRKRSETSGLFVTTFSHAKVFQNREYDGLSVRFNYEFQLGTPNKDLEELFTAVFSRMLAQLASKETAFQNYVKRTSQQTDGAATP